MIEKNLFQTFQDIGRDIFLRGLISSHAGNMSVRAGNKMFLTRRGSMLGSLKESDIVEIDFDEDNGNILMATSEFVVHRAIYMHTRALSIIHTHPPYATLLSMLRDEIIPVDSEGSYLFKKVPVAILEKTIGSSDAAGVISKLLRDYRIVLMRGHGSFARGDMLEEAYMLTSSLEASSFFIYHMDRMINKDRPGKDYRRHSDKYKNW